MLWQIIVKVPSYSLDQIFNDLLQGNAISAAVSTAQASSVLQVDANGRADWHDYAQAAKDAAAQGPGEQGTDVELPKDSATERRKERLYKVCFKADSLNLG